MNRLFSLFFLFVLISCGKKEKENKPEYKELTEAVYASGNIIPQDEYTLYAQGEGYLQEKVKDVGDTVKTGEILFKIESTAPKARFRSSEEAYRIAQLNTGENSPVLLEIKSQIASAKARMDNDSLNASRFKNLLKENATSKAEADRMALAYKISKNDYTAAVKRYQRTKEQLQLELKNAESQFEINRSDEKNYQLTSNVNGVIFDVKKEVGELVRRGEALAIIGKAGKGIAKLLVDELDIKKIKIGQEVLIKSDIYKGKVFKARVAKIYPQMIKEDQSFRIDAEFTDEAPTRFSGINIEANIIISHKPNTLVIPKQMLIGEDSVAVKRDDKKQKIKITKGAENFDFVEVTSGLDTTDILVKP